jgi:hypothetical protein
MSLDFATNNILPTIIILIGFIENASGVIVISRKELKKIFQCMSNAFNYDPTIISNIGCKIYNFFSYGLDAL